jgi:hypothetical protein
MASLDDILTTQKNGVVALNRVAQALGEGYPLTPYNGGQGASITATTSSSRVALIGASANAPYALVCNQSAIWVSVQFGDSTVIATTASMSVPPGACALVTITPTSGAIPTHMAAITSSSTAFVQVTVGYSGT